MHETVSKRLSIPRRSARRLCTDATEPFAWIKRLNNGEFGARDSIRKKDGINRWIFVIYREKHCLEEFWDIELAN